MKALTNTHTRARAHTHAHTCKQWFVTSLRNACCLISARSLQAPLNTGGGPRPVNDKPIVFARVEPFRCKSLHFSSHTRPHNSALECNPRGHSKVDCISPRNSACKPMFVQLVGEKKHKTAQTRTQKQFAVRTVSRPSSTLVRRRMKRTEERATWKGMNGSVIRSVRLILNWQRAATGVRGELFIFARLRRATTSVSRRGGTNFPKEKYNAVKAQWGTYIGIYWCERMLGSLNLTHTQLVLQEQKGIWSGRPCVSSVVHDVDLLEVLGISPRQFTPRSWLPHQSSFHKMLLKLTHRVFQFKFKWTYTAILCCIYYSIYTYL